MTKGFSEEQEFFFITAMMVPLSQVIFSLLLPQSPGG